MNDKIAISELWDFIGRIGIFFGMLALLNKVYPVGLGRPFIIEMFIGFWLMAPLYKMFFEKDDKNV